MKDEAHIQRMLEKQYDFDVKFVLSKARELSSVNNLTIVLAMLALALVAMLIGYVIIYSFNINATTIEDLTKDIANLSDAQIVITNLSSNIVLAPLFAGLAMLAISTVRGQETKVMNVFSYVSSILPLGVATMLISIATSLGMQLLLLPGFYVMMASSFAYPLIIDKRLTPISAILLSARMTNAYLFQMSMIFLVFVALFIATAFTFGLALIWVGPYFYNVKAVLYTELFCSKEEQPMEEKQQPGVFNA